MNTISSPLRFVILMLRNGGDGAPGISMYLALHIHC